MTLGMDELHELGDEKSGLGDGCDGALLSCCGT